MDGQHGEGEEDMPGFKGVRYSKFRHVYGQPFRKEWCYDSIRISKNTYDSNFCAVNPKYLAVIAESGGGGCFIVIPVENCGRVDMNTPKVNGHTAQVLDVKWYPFDDNIIASSSEDGTVIVWRIPEEMTENLTEYMVLLRGHGRKCGFIEWHPTAEFILASGGFDGQVIVWNVEQGKAVFQLSCGRNAVLSVSFNWDGSLLATTSKDKKLRIFDPRTQELLQEGECHTGAKGGKCTFLGEADLLVTTGSERSSARQLKVWDQHDLSKPLASADVSNGTGVLFPFPDHDNNVLYVAGKGDGNIRYYEITETSPFIHSLNEYISGNPQRGLGSMPKRGLNTANCEIMRFYKLYASKAFVEPISMIVPRRYDSMQKDLYPDTCGTEPAMTADEWLSGINRPPKLLSLGGVSRKRRTEPQKRPTPQPTQEKTAPTSTPAPTSAMQTERSVQNPSFKETRVAEIEKEVEKPVEVKKPRQELKPSPPVHTVNPMPQQEMDNLDQWEIISEDIVISSTTKVEESSMPSSEVSHIQESKQETTEKVNGTYPESKGHVLPGMEGSIPLSERLAKFQNNNNNEASPRRTIKVIETSTVQEISKREKRTNSESERQNPPTVKETNSKVERSFSSEGKETFRIEVDDTVSILPSKNTISQSKEENSLVFLPGTTSPSKLNRRESSSDPPAPAPRRPLGSSGDAKEPLSSREMGADQIRKAYLRQLEEIKQLKTQLTLKDARIRQLEKELEQYTASNC